MISNNWVKTSYSPGAAATESHGLYYTCRTQLGLGRRSFAMPQFSFKLSPPFTIGLSPNCQQRSDSSLVLTSVCVVNRRNGTSVTMCSTQNYPRCIGGWGWFTFQWLCGLLHDDSITKEGKLTVLFIDLFVSRHWTRQQTEAILCDYVDKQQQH